MSSFVDRYRRGEFVQVWDELVALGDRVRVEPLLSDARAVAHETMRRVSENIDILIPRLRDIGYEFAFRDRSLRATSSWWGDNFPIYEHPVEGATVLIDELEEKLGPMPLSLRAWYEVVGTVNLIGSRAGWPETDVLDPLVVAPLPDMLQGIESEYENWQANREEDLDSEPYPFTWDFAPDDLHKANISGGPPYGIEYPSTGADAAMRMEWHDTTFVDYLRICFRWGGFPGWERVDTAERPAECLSFLTEGLLAI